MLAQLSILRIEFNDGTVVAILGLAFAYYQVARMAISRGFKYMDRVREAEREDKQLLLPLDGKPVR